MAVRRLDLIITSNATAAIRGFASLEGAAKRVETRFGKAGRALFTLGAIGAVGFAAFTAKSVKAFIDFDDAMVKSTAILDNISGPVRKRLEEAAKSVARVTTFSATEAAEAYYGLFSAGLDAEQSISALPVVAQFAQAGLMDMAQATDYLVNSQSALGISFDDPIKNMQQMQRVADVLTETNNLATGTVEEFADALTHKAGGALKTVGKDIEEGAASLAYLAEQGIRGSRAGESLAIFIRDVSRAAGNPTFKGAFRKFGIEVFDASGNLKNLADVVGEFEGALGPMSDKERAVTLEQLGLTRSVGDVIRQLMGGSGAIKGYEMALRNAGGATQSVADNQMESLRSKIDLIKNRLNVLMIDFGEPIAIWLVDVFFPWFETKFMPALVEVSSLVRDELRPAFDEMAKALDNPVVIKFLSALTGFLLVMIAGSKAVKIFTTVIAPLVAIVKFAAMVFGELRFALFAVRYFIVTAIIPVLEALATALGVSVGVLLLIVVAVIAVVAAIYIFRAEIVDALQAVGRFFVRLWDDIYSGFVMPIVRFFTQTFPRFWKGVWHAVEGPLRVFLRVLQVIFSVALGIVLAPFIISTGIIIAIVRQLIKFFDTNWPKIWRVISSVWKAIVTITTFTWNEIIWPRIKFVWDLIYRFIVLRLKATVQYMRIQFGIARAVVTFLWNAIKAVIFASWHAIRDRVIKPFAVVWEGLILPKLRTFWRGAVVIWNALKVAFSSSWHWIRDNVLKPVANYWADHIMPKISDFADWISIVWASIKENTAAIWRGIVGAVKTPVNAIIRIINSLISGMNTVIDLINKIPGVAIPKIPSIPLIGGGGSNAAQNPGEGGALVHHAMGTYDLAKRGPFKTDGARAIVGEGDPRYPEYVIPTDPRFRGRANSLFSGLASDLGIGYQFGGIIDSVGDGIRGAIDAAGGFVEDLSRGALKAAFSPFNEAAKGALNAVPEAMRLRGIAQGFRELLWQVITGADGGFPEVAAGAGPGGAVGRTGAGLGGNPAANRRLGMKLNAARGWAFMWNALDALVMSESGWNNNAQNPTSTAYGIGQFLNSTWAGVGYSKTSDPQTQILAMLAYIASRYGNPNAAWNFKRSHNWYGMGGLLPSFATGLYQVPSDNFPAMLHRKEMVLPADAADATRDVMEGRGGRGGTTVHIENFNINIDGAGSIDDARRKARAAGKAFLSVLEERRVLTDARIS